MSSAQDIILIDVIFRPCGQEGLVRPNHFPPCKKSVETSSCSSSVTDFLLSSQSLHVTALLPISATVCALGGTHSLIAKNATSSLPSLNRLPRSVEFNMHSKQLYSTPSPTLGKTSLIRQKGKHWMYQEEFPLRSLNHSLLKTKSNPPYGSAAHLSNDETVHI